MRSSTAWRTAAGLCSSKCIMLRSSCGQRPAAGRVRMRGAIMWQARISQKRTCHASQSSQGCSNPLAGGLSHRAAARQVFKDHSCNRGEARFNRDVSYAGGAGAAWVGSRKHGKKNVACNPPRESVPLPALWRAATSQARSAQRLGMASARTAGPTEARERDRRETGSRLSGFISLWSSCMHADI